MSVEEQRNKMMELVDGLVSEPSPEQPSTFEQSKILANEELNEIVSEMELIMKKFERSEIFNVFGKKYIETILSSSEKFAKVINKDVTKEQYEKLNPNEREAFKRQQKKRREFLQKVAKSYGLI